MKVLIFIAILIHVAACSNKPAVNIKLVFYPDYFTGLETQQIESYNDAVLDYDLTSPSNENIHFSNCLQVDATKDSGIVSSEYHLFTMLKLNCKALKMYSLAGASEHSYLDELLINKDIRNLPATAYPYQANEEKLRRENKKLSEYQKTLDIDIRDNGEINVTTEQDSLVYQVIATGDFNADKIEDALIRIDWHVIDAFGKGSNLILITKRSPSDEFEIIDLAP